MSVQRNENIFCFLFFSRTTSSVHSFEPSLYKPTASYFIFDYFFCYLSFSTHLSHFYPIRHIYLTGTAGSMEELEEAQMNLQAMLTMRHVTPFRERAQDLLQALSETSDTLGMLIGVHTVFSYYASLLYVPMMHHCYVFLSFIPAMRPRCAPLFMCWYIPISYVSVYIVVGWFSTCSCSTSKTRCQIWEYENPRLNFVHLNDQLTPNIRI